MNYAIHISRRANSDLASIWDYTARECGPDAADEYISLLDASMESLTEFPKIGADSSHVRNGYRKLRSGSHLIFYIPHNDGIEVVRILHERMDITSEMGSDDFH